MTEVQVPDLLAVRRRDQEAGVSGDPPWTSVRPRPKWRLLVDVLIVPLSRGGRGGVRLEPGGPRRRAITLFKLWVKCWMYDEEGGAVFRDLGLVPKVVLYAAIHVKGLADIFADWPQMGGPALRWTEGGVAQRLGVRWVVEGGRPGDVLPPLAWPLDGPPF